MGWLSKLKTGLKSSSEKISDGVSGILSKEQKDETPEVTDEAQPTKVTQPETTEPVVIEPEVIEPELAEVEEIEPETIKVEEPKKIEVAEKTTAKPARKKTSGGLIGIFTKRKLNEAILQDLEDLLITADLGIEAATEITEKLRSEKFDKDISEHEIKQFLAEEITEILEPVAKTLEISNKPHIVLVVGVNGNGKTTSIGKIAHHYKSQGKQVQIAAADTFRAAAVEQLQEWGKRADVPVFTGMPNQDPASVAYQAIEKAIADDADLLMIDTAGRLQNKHNLMQELEKIKNVSRKQIADAPHETILVLDATTGQNALSQVEEFKKSAEITGLIVTKLDGTAKGGVIVALAKKFDINIHAIGVGEGIDDLKPFNAKDFAENLVGLE